MSINGLLRLVNEHKLIVTFVALSLIGGVAFSKIAPPFWGADEVGHYMRAYSIATGHDEFLTFTDQKTEKKIQGQYYPVNLDNFMYRSYDDLTDERPGGASLITDQKLYNNMYSMQESQVKKAVGGHAGTGIYPQISYGAPVIGITLSRMLHLGLGETVWVARIFNLLQYVLITAAALFVARKHAVRWILAAIALLPMAVYQASIVNPDSLNFSLAFLWFALTVSFIDKTVLSRKALLAYGFVTILFVVTKPIFILLVALVPWIGFSKLKTVQQRKIVRFIIPLLSIVCALLWIMHVSSHIANSEGQSTTITQLKWLLVHPFDYVMILFSSFELVDWVKQIIGSFGANFISTPIIVTYLNIIWLSLIPLFVTEKIKSALPKKIASLMLIHGVVAICAIITFLYLTWNPVGASAVGGVQGRYFLPVLPLILYGATASMKQRIVVSEKAMIATVIIIAGASLILSAGWYYKIIY